jgi:hypothetical protein
MPNISSLFNPNSVPILPDATEREWLIKYTVLLKKRMEIVTERQRLDLVEAINRYALLEEKLSKATGP